MEGFILEFLNKIITLVDIFKHQLFLILREKNLRSSAPMFFKNLIFIYSSESLIID